MDPKALETMAKTMAFRQFVEEDRKIYNTLCRKIRESANRGECPFLLPEAGGPAKSSRTDFDLFEHASKLSPQWDVWKPFLAAIKALAGQAVTTYCGDEEHEKRVMRGIAIVRCVCIPIICGFMFPSVMAATIPNREKCAHVCVRLVRELETPTRLVEIELSKPSGAD